MPSATERSRTHTRAQLGMDSPQVTVETHLPGGLPGFTLVGLPETAVREARDRVKSAVVNCGFDFPVGRVVVNLAPADLAKEGARFDLAIALSLLSATGQIPHGALDHYEFLGELSLAGELRATRGSLCAALALLQESERPIAGRPPRRLVIPAANGYEAQLARHAVVPLGHLSDVVALLRQGAGGPTPTSSLLPAADEDQRRTTPPVAPGSPACGAMPFAHVLGQHAAKRALVIAAAGGHHMLMVGPPGTGKTLLARSLADLLPKLEHRPALEVAAVYSAAGLAPPPPYAAPFRDPHHSASAPALVGGGSRPCPGEISLAHHGVLFLDELPHFKPSVLNHLREPLESRQITIARSRTRACFPARFQLIAAMNPCPAGRVCDPSGPAHDCRCTPDQARRYRARISGPLLDRIDLHVSVPPVPKELLVTAAPTSGPQADPRALVALTRRRQLTRQGLFNVDLAGADLPRYCALDAAGSILLSRAVDRYKLSARGVHRVLRVARSVADLAEQEHVALPHLTEALGFRAMDWDGAPGAGPD